MQYVAAHESFEGRCEHTGPFPVPDNVVGRS